MQTHDLFGHTKSYSRAFFSGGIEGDEDRIHMIQIYATSVIGDRNMDTWNNSICCDQDPFIAFNSLQGLNGISDQVQSLTKIHPEQYLIVNEQLQPNPVYNKLKTDLFNLKRKLEKKIKLESSLESNQVNDFQIDRRNSIYKLHAKVSDIITKYQLKESE